MSLGQNAGCPLHCATLTGTTAVLPAADGTVTFSNLRVHLPDSSASRRTNTVQSVIFRFSEGQVIGDSSSTFKLVYQPDPLTPGYMTTEIRYDAGSNIANETETTRGTSMQSKLQALPRLGRVEVERTQTNPLTSYRWDITFSSLASAGAVRRLRVARHENRLPNTTTLETKMMRLGEAYSLRFEYQKNAEATKIHGTTAGFHVEY